jgi:ligand-binding sensor domain-containing protein
MKPPIRKTLLLLLVLALIAGLIGVWQVKQRADRQLVEERARRDKQDLIPFEQKLLKSISSKAIEIWQNHQATRAIVRFNDSYFVASDGGLIELDLAGKLVRHYTVLDGLPESDLLSLAVFNSKLFIGTRTEGLVEFNGSQFHGFRWTDRTSQSIDALFADEGRLLIGTRAGGLIAFNGREFKELTAGLERQRLLEITQLSKDGSRLFVGTFADGLWIEEGGRWSHFTTVEGLLSNRVVGVAVAGQNLFVATDFGLSVIENTQDHFQTLVTIPSLSSIALTSDRLVLSKDNGETFSLRTDQEIAPSRQVTPVAWARAGNTTGTRLIALDNHLWLLTEEGIYRAAGADAFVAWGQSERNRTLTTNLVSALMIDSQARVWAGNFRRGIDVHSAQGTRLDHL